MSNLELMKPGAGAVTTTEQTSSAQLLAVIARAAASPEIDIGKMERLLAMQERVMAKEAESAFNNAMQAAQSEMPIVLKDAINPSTNSKFTKLETLYRAVVPVITRHGFAISFGTSDCPLPGHFRVTARVTNKGHSEKYQADIPSDHLGAKGAPSKTLTHGFGSSMSYGRRYLTMLIFNVATGDDDGNAAGKDADTPEIKAGLKAILWGHIKKHFPVSNWDQAQQNLIDENLIEQTENVRDLLNDVAAMRKLVKKLEAR